MRDAHKETLAYIGFPREHWRRIRINNPIEQLNREIRRRTCVVGTFPNGKTALMLVIARLRYVAESKWGRGATWMRCCWTSDRTGWRAYGTVGKFANILTTPLVAIA